CVRWASSPTSAERRRWPTPSTTPSVCGSATCRSRPNGSGAPPRPPPTERPPPRPERAAVFQFDNCHSAGRQLRKLVSEYGTDRPESAARGDREDHQPARRRPGRSPLTTEGTVEDRLDALEAERAILDTLYRYGHTIDYGDEAGWVDCFTTDAVYDVRR